jgi:hypothetical protein
MPKMPSARAALSLLPLLLLAACGGGGGDGGSSTAQPVQLAVTTTNAQPVAADALQTSGTTGVGATGAALVTGVQVEAASGGAAPLQLAGAARHLLGMVPPAPALATAATISQSATCTGGGTVSISGNVASSSQLSTGDQITITANACSEVVDGTSERLDGTLSITVLAGPFNATSTSFPKSVQLRIVAQRFSLVQGGQTTVSDGDLQISVVQSSSTVASTTLSAAVLSSTVSTASSSRQQTLRNYSQKIDQTSTQSVVTVSATVETNNTRLGGGTLVSYGLSTPAPLTLNASGAYTGGSLRVTGAASGLLLTVNGTDTFILQVDANGDGIFESNSTVTRAQLNAQL